MTDMDAVVGGLLALAQVALAVIAADAVLEAWFNLGFLTGMIRDFAYLGGLVGLADQLYWLATERIPKVLDMY